jgi:plasmid maintenance system antidote protein VapI
MPKNAQEWQASLNLNWLPDESEVAEFNQAESKTISAGKLPDEAFASMTIQELTKTVSVDSVGALFRSIRVERGETVRTLAENIGVSPARASQLEQPSVNLTVQTIAEMASRLGYDARLVLRPKDDPTRTFEATLEVQEA